MAILACFTGKNGQTQRSRKTLRHKVLELIEGDETLRKKQQEYVILNTQLKTCEPQQRTSIRRTKRTVLRWITNHLRGYHFNTVETALNAAA